MKKTKFKVAGALASTFKKIIPHRSFVSAVILAAGSGSRMNSAVTKQWLKVDNVPVFIRSLLSFDACDKIKEIILCVKEDEKELYDDVIKQYGIKKLKKIVVGGKTRAQSALCGFKAISDRSTHVAIHDAARCLITPQMIDNVILQAKKHGCACAASPACDTVKIAFENGFIDNTPTRSLVWNAQTPQIFRTEIYRASAYYALERNITVTDDCSMVEHAGFKIKLVDCGKENIKITEEIDLYLAEAILKKRALSEKETKEDV